MISNPDERKETLLHCQTDFWGSLIYWSLILHNILTISLSRNCLCRQILVLAQANMVYVRCSHFKVNKRGPSNSFICPVCSKVKNSWASPTFTWESERLPSPLGGESLALARLSSAFPSVPTAQKTWAASAHQTTARTTRLPEETQRERGHEMLNQKFWYS